MEKVAKILWYIAVVIFALTGVLTIVGVFYIWFINPDRVLPYLGTLFTTLIIEVIGICLVVLKNSANFAPKTVIYKNKDEVNKFLSAFATSGSSVDFVSNRASWLSTDEKLKESLIKKSNDGNKVSILTKEKPQNIEELNSSGIEFVNSVFDEYTPNARFTIINSNRQGSEELAIAMGNFPNHKVYTFNGQNSPYIIAMAKDIINLMKLVEEKTNE